MFQEDFLEEKSPNLRPETHIRQEKIKSVSALRVIGWRKRWSEGCPQKTEHMNTQGGRGQTKKHILRSTGSKNCKELGVEHALR